MRRILTCTYLLFVYLNYADCYESTVFRCLLCSSFYTPAECAVSVIDPNGYGCSQRDPECVEFSGILDDGRPVFARHCNQGGCEKVKKGNPDMKVISCRSCKDHKLCNNGTFVDITTIAPPTALNPTTPKPGAKTPKPPSGPGR